MTVENDQPRGGRSCVFTFAFAHLFLNSFLNLTFVANKICQDK